MLVRGVAWRKQVEWRSALCSLSGRAALSYSPRALVRPSVPGSLFFFVSVRSIRCGVRRTEWHSQANPSVEGTGRAHPVCPNFFLASAWYTPEDVKDSEEVSSPSSSGGEVQPASSW